MGWFQDQDAKIQANRAAGKTANDKFWGDAKNWWNDVSGKNTKDAAATQTKTANDTMNSAATTAGNLAGVSGTQSAQEAGAAGSALGETMGRTAATEAGTAAARSARTSGLNAGQAAMVGGQQSGTAFTQGQQTGQGLGMQAYQSGADRQLNAASTQGTIGANQAGAANAQFQNGKAQNKQLWEGVGNVAGAAGKFLGLAKGGIVDKPTAAVVGEAGPEAVLPLSDMGRVREIIKGIRGTPAAAEIAKTVEPEAAKETPKEEPKKKRNDHYLKVIAALSDRLSELEGGE